MQLFTNSDSIDPAFHTATLWRTTLA